MKVPQKRFSAKILPVCLSLGLAVALYGGHALLAQENDSGKDGRTFEDFNNAVENYMELRGQAQERLGRTALLGMTDSGQDIVEREHALAGNITRLRTRAMQGEIFTPEVSAYFANVLNSAYRLNAESISASLACVSELVEQTMNPNDVYPITWGYNMMPPTMLLRMPPLPQELEYRIVNRDIIIRDVEANLVVDVMRNAITFPLEGAPCDE